MATTPALEINTSRQFTNWMLEQKLSLGFTTYQAGKLFLLGLQPNGRLSVFERTFNRCLGLWSDGPRQRRPRYQLTARTVVSAPIADVFEFFSRPENLGVMTPATMGFRITERTNEMAEGALISYRIRLGPAPMRWTTRIEAWDSGTRFVDAQLRGPYHCWWHEHRFIADGPSRTIMEDRVLYTPPLGVLGRFANYFFIKRALRGIFTFRSDAIRLRFGGSIAIPAVAAVQVAS